MERIDLIRERDVVLEDLRWLKELYLRYGGSDLLSFLSLRTLFLSLKLLASLKVKLVVRERQDVKTLLGDSHCFLVRWRPWLSPEDA